MAKQGFGGQWIPIAAVGKFIDSDGEERDLSVDFLKSVVANYSAQVDQHEAPAVIGHPKEDNPAFGWVSELRLNGDVLEAKFAETDDEFEKLVEQGRFKKRSTSFYLEPPKRSMVKAPTIKHVGFLGAAAPSVKGLRNIQFAEGESFTLEESFNLQENEMGLEDKDVEKVTEGLFQKIKNFMKPPVAASDAAPATSAFSEASIKDLIADAVNEVKEEVTAEFTEKLKEKDDELKELRESVDAGTASGRRAEIISFVEKIPAEKGRHFLKRAGIVEFLEACAVADAKDKAKAISFSEGIGDDKVDHELSRLEWAKNLFSALPNFVEFGEKFGNIVATKEADAMINSDRVNAMKKAAGVEEKAAGGDK